VKMEKRLEKAIDSIDSQAYRLDAIERSIESVSSQILAVREKQDRLISMLETMLDNQVNFAAEINRLDELNTAEMELFLRLSKRVDTLEAFITPCPGSGNGSGRI
jgi:hypothetical protein